MESRRVRLGYLLESVFFPSCSLPFSFLLLVHMLSLLLFLPNYHILFCFNLKLKFFTHSVLVSESLYRIGIGSPIELLAPVKLDWEMDFVPAKFMYANER